MTSLLPDPDALAEQLEHARGARDHLERVIAWLQEGIELLGPAPAQPPAIAPAAPAEHHVAAPGRQLEAPSSDPGPSDEAPKPEPGPAVDDPTPVAPSDDAPTEPASELGRPPAPSVRLAPRDVEGKVLHAIIKANTALSASQVADRVGMPKGKPLMRALRALVRDGKVLAEGATKSRRYRRTQLEEFHTETRAKVEASKTRNTDDEASRIRRVGLRDRVLKAIAADPDALDVDRLALALNEPRDDIANACEAMILSRKIVRGDDGTFRRNSRMEMAA